MTRRLRAWILRLWAAFGGAGAEPDFNDELRSHLELHAADLIQSGVSPDRARRQAVLAIGGTTQARERHRDQRAVSVLSEPDGMCDTPFVRYGARRCLRQRSSGRSRSRLAQVPRSSAWWTA